MPLQLPYIADNQLCADINSNEIGSPTTRYHQEDSCMIPMDITNGKFTFIIKHNFTIFNQFVYFFYNVDTIIVNDEFNQMDGKAISIIFVKKTTYLCW